MNDAPDDELLRPPDPRMIPSWEPPAPSFSSGDLARARARHAQRKDPPPGEADTLRAAGTGSKPSPGTGSPAASHGPARGAQHSATAWSSRSAGDAAGQGIDDIVIRPFLLTGGRTRPSEDGLRVETLVQASPGVSTANLRFELRQIVELCRKPCSVAEIAAAMRVPIGVARVLVSDLVADECVTLLQREELSIQLIERIRDRVRAL